MTQTKEIDQQIISLCSKPSLYKYNTPYSEHEKYVCLDHFPLLLEAAKYTNTKLQLETLTEEDKLEGEKGCTYLVKKSNIIERYEEDRDIGEVDKDERG